jgi:hypothetical protein
MLTGRESLTKLHSVPLRDRVPVTALQDRQNHHLYHRHQQYQTYTSCLLPVGEPRLPCNI